MNINKYNLVRHIVSFMERLPNKDFQAMVPLLREKEFYEHEQIRKIHWPEYNESQIKEVTESLDFIRDQVDRCAYLKVKGKVGRPLTDPKSLAKAVLICEAFDFKERESQGWIKLLGPYVGIPQEIDERVIGEAYDHPEVIFILKQVFENSKTSDGKNSGDGTGLETSRKQNYEMHKKTSEYMTSIVDSREIVQAFDISGKQECQAMHELIEKVRGTSLLLDAGFVDRKLIEKISALGMKPFVFPKKSLKLNGSFAWKQMYLELYYDVMAWLKEYHQRSHAESFHSSFKRKNGVLLKRRNACILSQVTARIIIHNRSRLAYFNRIPKET